MTPIPCRRTLALLLTLTAPALAAAGPDRHERGRDHQELQGDRQGLRDDLRDAERAGWLLQEFDRARATRDRRGMAEVEARVAQALEDELREADREVREAAREARQSDRELRDERGEVLGDLRRDQPGRLADDRRDRRDLMREADYRERVLAVRGEWSQLRGSLRRVALDRKHALLEELVRLSRFEIRASEDELREDRGELREDRREWREDRREHGRD
jgi:hypothetical protein